MSITASNFRPARAALLDDLLDRIRHYSPLSEMPQDSRQRMREIRAARFIELYASDVADALDSDEPADFIESLVDLRDKMKAHATAE